MYVEQSESLARVYHIAQPASQLAILQTGDQSAQAT